MHTQTVSAFVRVLVDFFGSPIVFKQKLAGYRQAVKEGGKAD